MPRTFNAPGVYRREIDLSEILVPAGISDAGIVIRSKKGPINRPVLIANDKEFIETFGEPYYVSGTSPSTTKENALIPEYGYGSYAALEYLKESSTLYVVRDFTEASDKYASVNVTNVTNSITSTSGTGISGVHATVADRSDRISILDSEAESSNSVIFASVAPGVEGNNVAITIEPFNTSADWKFSYDAYPLVASATSAEFLSGTADVGLTGMGTTSQALYYPIASKVFKINVYEKDDDKEWTDLYNTTSDKDNSKLRIAAKETFYGTLIRKQDGNKNQLFIEDVVNGNSKLIYAKVGGSFTDTAWGPITNSTGLPVLEDTTSEYLQYSKLIQLTGGTRVIDNGLNDSTGWNLFDSREDVNVGILIGHSYDAVNKAEIARVAAKRLDCIAVCQTGELADETVSEVLDAENYGYQESSYVSLYAGYSKVYDKYNDRNVFLPNSIFGAALMARVDNISYPWMAPAGINRGIIPVLDQRRVWSSDEIGKLYTKNINVPKFVRGAGYAMWGQKTSQLKKTALDRINVRRLLLYIENNLEPALLQYLFENNTAKTRLRVFSVVDEFLSGVDAAGGVTNYDVVVDESNNTPAVIDSNQLNVDIYVQPAKSIEYIQLSTIITRSGISFSEVRVA